MADKALETRIITSYLDLMLKQKRRQRCVLDQETNRRDTEKTIGCK